MIRIVAHIERLMATEDCVILPGLGGFVRQALPAAYDKKTHTFHPARVEWRFNASLRHPDGLLEESYRQTLQVDRVEAQAFMEEDLERLRSQLKEERQLSLGRIGRFSLGEEDQLLFSPGDSVWMNADLYGLKPFVLLPLSEQAHPMRPIHSEEEPIARKEIYYIPISRRLAQALVGAAAAMALFFLPSTPVVEVNPTSYTASFVPTEMIPSTTSSQEEIPSAEENWGADDVEELPELVAPALPAVQPAQPAPVPIREEQKSVARKMYHLVIASFPTRAQADEFLATVDRSKHQQVDVIARGGKFRVYAERFDNRAEAEQSLVQLRQTERYKDAWLFISQ